MKKRHAHTGPATVRTEHFHTFQQLRTDIYKLQLLPQVSLVQLPNAGDEGVFFSSAAGHPPVHLLKMEVKFRIFLNHRSKREYVRYE